MYLYRAVDSQGNTLDFHLSPTRDAQAAKRFFSKVLGASHTITPRVITVDKNAAYPKALRELKQEEIIPEGCQLRQSKYLNNLVEQDHLCWLFGTSVLVFDVLCLIERMFLSKHMLGTYNQHDSFCV